MIKNLEIECPVQGKKFNVDVNYIETTSIEDTTKRYARGIIECSYVRNGGYCDKECPSINIAPRSI